MNSKMSKKNEKKKDHEAQSRKAAAKAALKASKGRKSKSISQLLWVFAILAAVMAVIVGANYNSLTNFGSSKRMDAKDILERAKHANCKDRENPVRCAKMVEAHGCDSAPGWMAVMCAASCDRCELLDPKIRCDTTRLNMSTEPAFKPGEMYKMFRNLKQKFPEYNVQTLSQPPDGPWVVSFENFIDDFEIKTLLEQAGQLKRSTDQGSVSEDGYQEQVVSKGRTSSNAWCQGACEQHPVIIDITKRIENITGVPRANYESFQILRYNIGEEYQRHHDMSPSDNLLPCGPRILTFFLYLSDVEEGGGTRFTEIDVTMQPKKGSAILWPSVLNDDLTMQDSTTFHQALPVIKGVKYAANHWIHLYDYKTPNLWGCTGAFA